MRNKFTMKMSIGQFEVHLKIYVQLLGCTSFCSSFIKNYRYIQI